MRGEGPILLCTPLNCTMYSSTANEISFICNYRHILSLDYFGARLFLSLACTQQLKVNRKVGILELKLGRFRVAVFYFQ